MKTSFGLQTAWLVSLRRSLRRRLLGRGKPRPVATWDAQYHAGAWDGIAAETERHACIASLARQMRGDAGGCYVGLDISSEAIWRAGEEAVPGETFHALDVEAGPPAFLSPGSVDAAIFSEVLYYLDDPLATLRRFAPVLSRRGFFVFSLWKPSRHRALRRGLSREYDESCSVEVGLGDTWRISVCVPRGVAGPVPV